MSIHIKYERNIRTNLFEAYYKAFEFYARKFQKNISQLKILDIGCGRGEFLEYARAKNLNVTGCDFDKTCLAMSKKFASVFFMDIEEGLNLEEKYDLILLSHVLEHIRCPAEFLQKLRVNCSAIVLGVPNPTRPNVVFNFCVKQKYYCNKGHYYSWDRSHFQNFLELCGFQVLSWHADDFHFPDWRVVRLGRKLGLSRIESRLKGIFPHLSTSHICLVDASEKHD